jgi:type IV pilus assembly protein PilM
MTTNNPWRSSNVIARAFPAPTYLTMPAAGIDISDYSIKHVFLARANDQVKIVSHGKIDLPLGTVERGEIKDMDTLVKLLTRLRKEWGYEYAHLALPEEHAYLFHTSLPKGTKEEMKQILEFHLKENVPVGADEAVFDYSMIHELPEAYEVNVSVYPSSIALGYEQVFDGAGFTLLSLEIEGQATARALLPPDHAEPTLIIDIGRNEASLSISTKGVVTFTGNIETGGDHFTRAIARGMDLSFQEAEKLKCLYGFRDTKESSVVFHALLPVVTEMKESINRHLMYWHMHKSAEGRSENEVTRVILVGGNASMVGVAEYLEAELEVPVEVGNVWRNVLSFEEQVPAISQEVSLEYATAVGLAIRSLARTG